MPETWLLLQSGLGGPAWNMALDEALLESAPQIGKPVLRFYGWTEPAASFGYSQRFTELERVTMLRPLIRRPTGGGFVPHDADWTYSLVFPPNHSWYSLRAVESYERVHLWIRDAFQKINVTAELSPCCKKEIPGQCFVGAEKSDVLWHGRKIAGAAQRRTKMGLLIQGSIQPPPIPLQRPDWENAMRAVAAEQFGVCWNEFLPSADLQKYASTLGQEKYSQSSYNQKR
jgi:lipoyl(octanoyl) transferase